MLGSCFTFFCGFGNFFSYIIAFFVGYIFAFFVCNFFISDSCCDFVTADICNIIRLCRFFLNLLCLFCFLCCCRVSCAVCSFASVYCNDFSVWICNSLLLRWRVDIFAVRLLSFAEQPATVIAIVDARAREMIAFVFFFIFITLNRIKLCYVKWCFLLRMIAFRY